MTENRIKALVDEAITLDRIIADSTDRLKEIKSMLVAEGDSREDEHHPTDGGGSSWETHGTDGSIARVTWPAPTLKSTVDFEKPDGAKLKQMVGKFCDQLFKPVMRYELVDKFRDRVREMFEPVDARRIIKACETKSHPKVGFETKDNPDAK